MKLMTKELERKIPKLYSTQHKSAEEVMAVCKFFTPTSNWTWYVAEYDGEDLFFGYVVGLDKEFGYFSLSELKSIRGPMGVGVERDRWFTPVSMKEIMENHSKY